MTPHPSAVAVSGSVRLLGGVSVRCRDAGLAFAAVTGPAVVLAAAQAYWLVVAFDGIDMLAFAWAALLVVLGAVGGIVLALAASAGVDDRRGTRRFLALATALIALGLFWWAVVTIPSSVALAKYLALCVPSTAFAVYAHRRVQRNRRMPWAAAALAFFWGTTVAITAAGTALRPVVDIVQQVVVPGTAFQHVYVTVAAANEELYKGVGTLCVLLLFRERVAGLLGGLAVGGIVGVGFQFNETAQYMDPSTGSAVYQLWARQYVGMFTSHPLFSALVGAGLGLAFVQAGWRRRVLCVACGYLAGFAGHAFWNNSSVAGLTISVGDPDLFAVVSHPLNVLVFSGPFLIGYSALVIAGLRFETAGLLSELQREAALGTGAVLPGEVRLLSSASARFRRRSGVLVNEGWSPYRRTKRLHATQLDLAYARWHRARGESARPAGYENAIRHAVHRHRAALTARPQPLQPQHERAPQC